MVVVPLGLNQVTVISRAAEAIRQTAVDCFMDSPFGAPSQSYVTVGTVPDDCCNALVVVLRSLVPTQTGQLNHCDPFRWESDWTLRLLRPCNQPGLGSIFNQLPAVTVSEPYEQMMMTDAAVLAWLFSPLVLPAVSAVVQPSFLSAVHCVDYHAGTLTPQRQADCAGWDYPFTLGIDYRSVGP